jgi:hypothetical protein
MSGSKVVFDASAIEFGSRQGVSIRSSNGNATMKNAK